MNENKLKTIRNQLGLSQIQFAKLLELQQSNYSKVEKGDRPINRKIIDLLHERVKVAKPYLYDQDNAEIFLVSNPLISDRIKQAMNNARVTLTSVEQQLEQPDRDFLIDVLNNKAYPDKAFLKRAFGSFGLVDIDYIEHGTSTYRIAKSDKLPEPVNEDAGKYESKYKKALEEIDYLREIITAMKRANEIMDEKIISLEEKLKSKTNEKKLP